jgi:methionine biosynthesis protein metW
MSVLEECIWDDRYRSVMADDGRILRQSISENIMQLPSPIASMLDIGCGTGDMVMAWAERGADAMGLDISAEAIRYAEAAAQRNCHFVIGDWDTLDLDAYGWRSAFDLVFSAMGPDMRNSAALQKMIACSRRYCRLLLFKDGRNELAEAASRRLGLSMPPSPHCGKDAILSQLPAYDVSVENVVCAISFEAATARWRSYLYALFPAQEHRLALAQLLEEYGGREERMTVQTEAVYHMLTWGV